MSPDMTTPAPPQTASHAPLPPHTTTPAEMELPVWVGGNEKWVTGLTRKTTCDDVIYALLRHEVDGGQDCVDVTSYVIFERWRGVERPLRGRTKVTKVWRAWGPECRNVKLYVRRLDNPMDSSSEILRTRRPRKHHHHHHSSHQQQRPHHHRDSKSGSRTYGHRDHKDSSRSRTHHGQSHRESRGDKHRSRNRDRETMARISTRILSRERKEESNPRVNPESRSLAPPCGQEVGDLLPPVYPTDPEHSDIPTEDYYRKSHEFHQLVQSVIEQEKQIQDQLGRLRETDIQIETYEGKLHDSRVRENGRNYVQEAYMREKSDDSATSGGEEKQKLAKGLGTSTDVQSYATTCEDILRIQQRISREETKIDDLSMQIFEESQLEMNASLATTTGSDALGTVDKYEREKLSKEERAVMAEIKRLKEEMKKCVSQGSAQQQQLREVNDTLVECEEQLGHQIQQVQALTSMVGTLEEEQNPNSRGICQTNGLIEPLCGSKTPHTDDVPVNTVTMNHGARIPAPKKVEILRDSQQVSFHQRHQEPISHQRIPETIYETDLDSSPRVRSTLPQRPLTGILKVTRSPDYQASQGSRDGFQTSDWSKVVDQTSERFFPNPFESPSQPNTSRPRDFCRTRDMPPDHVADKRSRVITHDPTQNAPSTSYDPNLANHNQYPHHNPHALTSDIYRIPSTNLDDVIMTGQRYDVTTTPHRQHNNSDSGVESNNDNQSSPTSSNPDPDMDQLFELPVVRGKTMVPYCTITTYDVSSSGSQSVHDGAMQRSMNVDDSNSDTGLSSLHSDDTNPAVLETLV